MRVYSAAAIIRYVTSSVMLSSTLSTRIVRGGAMPKHATRSGESLPQGSPRSVTPTKLLPQSNQSTGRCDAPSRLGHP